FHVAEIDEHPGVRVGLAAQRDGHLVVVPVQVPALALIAGKLVRGGEGELGLDFVHGHLVETLVYLAAAATTGGSSPAAMRMARRRPANGRTCRASGIGHQ